MSQDSYDPNSVDSQLTEIKTILKGHVIETKEYRKRKDAEDSKLTARVSALEGDKKKLLGFVAGVSAASGGIGAFVAKYFGGSSGH
jgi:hypothetical protein